MIVGFFEGEELSFKSTTHEHNLYHGQVDGELVLMCHQADDFTIALTSTAITEMLIAIINAHATMSSTGIGTPDQQGLGL